MKVKNILLAFDGYEQSLSAAELCWDLASKLPISLTAEHAGVAALLLWPTDVQPAEYNREKPVAAVSKSTITEQMNKKRKQ